MAEKKVEIAVGVTGAKQADAELARITKRMDDMNKRAVPPSMGKDFLSTLSESFGRGSDYGKWLKVAAGGGAIYALQKTTYLVEKAAEGFKQMASGAVSVWDSIKNFGFGVPILGNLLKGIQAVGEGLSELNHIERDRQAARKKAAEAWARYEEEEKQRQETRLKMYGLPSYAAGEYLMNRGSPNYAIEAEKRRAKLMADQEAFGAAKSRFIEEFGWGRDTYQDVLRKARPGMSGYGYSKRRGGAYEDYGEQSEAYRRATQLARTEQALEARFSDDAIQRERDKLEYLREQDMKHFQTFQQMMGREGAEQKLRAAIGDLFRYPDFSDERRQRIAITNRKQREDRMREAEQSGMMRFAYAPSQEWGARMTGYGMRDFERPTQQMQEQLKQLVSVNEKMEQAMSDGFRSLQEIASAVVPWARVEATSANAVNIFGTP